MKNKIFVKLAIIFVVFFVISSCIIGCTEEKKDDNAIATYPPSDIRPDNYNDCIRLGQYKGIEVEKNLTPSDQEIYSKYLSMLKTVSFEKVTDRAVENNDAINLDYVLYVDGKKFDGGTASGASIIIGSNSFIDGFEEACIGKKPNEEFDINISFPDPYEPNESLSGKPVKFTVKVNYIYPPLTDETAMLVGNGQYASAEDLYNTVKAEMKQGAEERWNSTLENIIISTVCDNSTIMYYPVGTIDNYKDSQEQMAELADVELWTYLGVSKEDCDKYLNEMAEKNVGMELVLHAVAEKEGIYVYESEYEARVNNYAVYGVNSKAEFVEKYGREYIIQTILMEKVTAFLVQNAVIIEK